MHSSFVVVANAANAITERLLVLVRIGYARDPRCLYNQEHLMAVCAQDSSGFGEHAVCSLAVVEDVVSLSTFGGIHGINKLTSVVLKACDPLGDAGYVVVGLLNTIVVRAQVEHPRHPNKRMH